MLKLSLLKRLAAGGAIAAALFATARMNAQNLTLEGQTGGFITPTAYVVYTDKDHLLSHPAVGFHFVNASSVIGYVYTFSIEEGIANRAEFGYTRSVHTKGNSPAFSGLWDFSGMNVFNGKVVAIKDGQFGAWTPGIGAGFVVRTGDKFVSGALNQELYGSSEVVHKRGCIRGSDQDLAASAGAFPAELRLEVYECLDLRTWAGSPRGSWDGSSAASEFRFHSDTTWLPCRRSDSRSSHRRW